MSRQTQDDDDDAGFPVLGETLFATTSWAYGANPAADADGTNDGKERLYHMINGYRDSGDLLVQATEAEPYRRRNLQYPIFFNYRQYIELHLKWMLFKYGSEVSVEPNFNSHSLVELWVGCRKIIEVLAWGDGDKSPIDALEFWLNEFDVIDPRSYAFRFAHKRQKKGGAETTSLPSKTYDLTVLRRRVAQIENLIGTVDFMLGNRE